MKDLNSPFKLEQFGLQHIGWNQFSDPFTKDLKTHLAEVVRSKPGGPINMGKRHKTPCFGHISAPKALNC